MKIKNWMIGAAFAFISGAILWGVSGYRGDRIGAVCEDGWRSQSTGSGTCSWHGGVDYWVYEKEPFTIGVVAGVALTFGAPIYAVYKYINEL